MPFDIRKDLFAPHGELNKRASREYIDALFDRFLASPEAEALPLPKKELGWVINQMRLGIDYLGVAPPDTSPGDLHEILFELFPRKVPVDASESAAIVTELAAFWLFLEREFELDNATACRVFLGCHAISRLRTELADPANFGPAKKFAMFSRQAGFDLDTEAGMAQAMLAYNDAVASRPPSGDPVAADPGFAEKASPPLPGDNFTSSLGLIDERPPSPSTARSKSRRKARRRAAKASRKKNRKRR